MDTSLENLLSYRPVTLRNEKERAIFRIQEGLCQGFRNFLVKQHFTEIHTQKIVAAGAAGGANIFSLKYFGKDACLAHLKEFYGQELSLLEVKLPEVTDIPVIGFHEAKDLIADTYGRKITDYEDFGPEEEKLLSEIMLKETDSDFIFVSHYPASKRPFYAMEAEKTVGSVPGNIKF